MVPDASDSIAELAVRALHESGGLGVVPTPLDDVAASLRYGPPEALFPADVPTGLLAVVRRLTGKVLGAVALRERVIYLDRGQNHGRQRFHHGHELGHIAIPWHAEAYYGDDERTLDPETRIALEDEANRFSVALLLQGDRYAREAADYRVGLAAPLELSARWDTSRHVAIRHYVASHTRPCALLLIGQYPVTSSSGPAAKLLAAFESPSWRLRYGPVTDAVPRVFPLAELSFAADALAAVKGETTEAVIEGEVVLSLGGVPRQLRYEVTSNTYRAFVLLYEPRRIELGRRVRPLWTPREPAPANASPRL